MNETKHNMISEQLEEDIRSGLFDEKLPSVRTLSSRFDVSTRTMNKAIKTLSAKGLVIPSGPRGILINQNRHIRPKTGNVVVFCNRDIADVDHDTLLHELNDVILASGMRPLFMNAPHSEIFDDEHFWKAGWVDGYIFVYSSFDRQFAHKLARINVPFVAANAVPDEYGVNWVDFDNDEMHKNLFREIAKRGYKRICYCAPMNFPESHQEHVQKITNPIRRKYGIDIDFCIMRNEALTMTSGVTTKYARTVIKHLQESPQLPEIIMTLFSPTRIKEELDAAGFDDIEIIAGLTSFEYDHEKEFPCAINSYHKLAKQTFGLFQKVLENPQAPPEHIYIPCKYYLDNLKTIGVNASKEITVCQ